MKTTFAEILKNKIKEKSRFNCVLSENTKSALKCHLEIDLVNNLKKQSYIRFDPTLLMAHEVKYFSGKTYMCIQKQFFYSTKEWLETNGFVLVIYPSSLDNLETATGEVVGEIKFQ